MKLQFFLIACAIFVSFVCYAQNKNTLSVHQNETSPTQIVISDISKITFENDEMNVIVKNSDEPHLFELSGINKITFDLVTEAVESITYNNTSLHLYPNPTENRLFIETEHEIEEIVIYDVYGRKCQQVNETTSQQVLDVTDLNAGIYFVKVVTDNNEIVKRFVKK